MYTAVKATTDDAELILKLYDLRREPVMRRARSFIRGFFPQSASDILSLAADFSSEENAYFRQVIGYWEMAASLALRGAIHQDLFLDNANEMFFTYAKFAPHIDEVREGLKAPRFFAHTEELINQTIEGRERLQTMIERQKHLAGTVTSAKKAA